VGFAVVTCIVFGWGGSKLVRESYGGAKVKAAEVKASHGMGVGEPQEPSPAPGGGA